MRNGAFFLKEKKGISPVVTTALLLVVAVVYVVGFQGWFDEFNSGLLVGVEEDSSFGSVKIDLSSCNLSKGSKYGVVGVFGINKIDVDVIVKYFSFFLFIKV